MPTESPVKTEHIEAVVAKNPNALRAKEIKLNLASNRSAADIRHVLINAERFPPSQDQIDLAMIYKFPPTERAADGSPVHTPMEQFMYNQAQESAARISKFLQLDTRSLSDASKKQLVVEVGQLLQSDPTINLYLEGLNDTQRKEAIWQLISRDRTLIGKVNIRFQELLDSNIQGSGANEAVQEAKLQKADAEKSLQQMRIETQSIGDQINSINTDLAEYGVKPNSSGGSVDGEKLAKIKELSQTKEEDEESVVSLTDQIKQINTRINTIELRLDNATGATRNDLESSLQRLENKREQLQKERVSKSARLKTLETLKTEEKALIDRKSELENRKNNIAKGQMEIILNYQKAQAALEIAERQQMHDQGKFIDDLNGVITQSVAEYMADQIEAAQKADAEIEEKRIAELAAMGEKEIADQLYQRWNEKKTIEKRRFWIAGKKQKIAETVVIKEQQVKADYLVLLQKGPDPIIEDMLKESGMNDADAAEKMKDQNFVKQMRSVVTEGLLRRELKIAKPSEGEMAQIMTTDWGKDAIKNAIASNKEASQMIDKLKADGVISDDPKEWGGALKDPTKKSIILWILGILFAAGAVSLGVPLLFNDAAKSVITGK